MENNIEKKRKLPTLAELYSDKAMTIKQNQLNELLNKDPMPEWIGYHPIIKLERIDPKTGQKHYEPMPYIPIARLEWLMFRIYTKWKKEIRNIILMANSAVVTMRVHYKDPLTGEWEWTDGVGAAPLQTNKGAGATDFMQIKSGAVQIGAPAAASFAFKNAVASLGKIFGKDLIRNDEIVYNLGSEIEKLKNNLPELLPKDANNWEGVKKGLLNGFTIDQIKSRWKISPENQEQILSEIA